MIFLKVNKIPGNILPTVTSRIIWLLVFVLLLNAEYLSAAERPSAKKFENKQLMLRLIPRSTPQMAGFFEARGFPAAMIAELSEYCFFTVIIKNKQKGVLHLHLADWEFVSQGQTLHRVSRYQWPPLWKKMNIPLASQSTFRWTLLPEALKFFADESEGGNIILKKTDSFFTLSAKFGVEEGKEPLFATINNLQCADAQESE